MHMPIDRIPEHLRGMTDAQLETYKSALTVMSELTNRWELAHRAGSQYEGVRDIYEALGYKTSLSYLDYYARYERQDIAAAIIDRPVEATWKDEFNLVESSDDEFTPLEKAWKILAEEFDVATKFERLDTLACIGQYAVLLFGLDDVTAAEGYASPVSGKPNLLYLKPIGENNAQIDVWDTDSTSPRFGMPQIYSIKIQIGDGTSNKILRVHHSRVLHVVGKTLESEILGRPMLQSVFNRLYDLEKTVGASAEMFWRGGRPGYKASVDENYSMSDADKDDLLAQIAEYEHNLRRILVAQGVSIESLAQQVADPSSVVDVLIMMISAVTGIPKRILTGSERGELASSTDRDSWMDLIDARRNKIATKQIIRPFVDRCIEYGILPPVKSEEEGYVIEWPDSYALTERDRVEIGKTRATALKEYAANPTAEDMLPLEAFLKIVLGLDDAQIALIEEMREAAMAEEEIMSDEEKALVEKQEEQAVKETLAKEEPLVQLAKEVVPWKKLYDDGKAHWTSDLHPSILAQNFAAKLLELKKESVLEIGCGNGRDSILFAAAGLAVTSIDLVPEAVSLAKENAFAAEVDIDIKVGDAEKLEFDDDSFDAVFTLSVLHSTDITKSLSEIYRVLKTDGIALIHLYSDVRKIDGEFESFVSVDEFISLVKELGFEVSDIFTNQEEEYDEAGEKHLVLVAEVLK